MRFLRQQRYLEALAKATKEAEQQVALDPTLKVDMLLTVFYANVRLKTTGKGRNKHHAMRRTAFSDALQDRSKYNPACPKPTTKFRLDCAATAANQQGHNARMLEIKRAKHLAKLERRKNKRVNSDGNGS